ncbi:LAFE_0A04214g1_1 [Lachancea fermentati]|uniref:LAFE_0A04214g1_1 n=1 Tax=Lachancea fermentati TaxID=4955 RepID=A0A1G4M6L7_LACFM|nr:LAFE_0A04214g1_1 [Lachancea fermentati]
MLAFFTLKRNAISSRFINTFSKVAQVSRVLDSQPLVKTTKPPKTSVYPDKYLRRSFVPKNKKRIKANGDLGNSAEDSLGAFLKVKPCTTITTAEAYDLSKVIHSLNASGYHPVNLIPGEIVSFKYLYDGCRADIMVLGNSGTVVSWGFDESCVLEVILPLLNGARVNPLPENLLETEDMDYVEIDTDQDLLKVRQHINKVDEGSLLEGDLMIINSTDTDQGLLDKAAFSSGMSRSTRLAVLEASLDAHIERTRKFTEALSVGRKLNVSESDILRSTGRLFLMRGKLNLYSELIETPDLYWSEPQLEKIYKQISKNLDIQPRITILNTKLDYATEESRALMAVLNEKKSTHLEWIIIYLITVEVCFELHHYYERYWLDKNTEVNSH